jgi:DNA-directed RNA polymerase specialized sigma24 family protein
MVSAIQHAWFEDLSLEALETIRIAGCALEALVSEGRSFLDLIRLVRLGDQGAAAELVRRYEPAIRRAVKMQLRDQRLRRVLDSIDICQSVLGNFFMRAAMGQFDLEQPDQLLKLLTVMARNKLATKARQSQFTRREYRAVEDNSEAPDPLTASDPSPSQMAAGHDLLEAVRGRLDPEERWLAEQRAQGREWADIAAERGGSPEALRKKLSRALDRVAIDLDLEEIRPV